jgi:aspartate/methionine/tyrosine aminotransferase
MREAAAAEVLAKITPRTRLIIVNGQPTGGIVPRDELDRLVEGLTAHPQVVVLSDEIYARMVYDNVPHASMLVYPELADRLILLDGWSKTYAMTGWRLGYAVWPQDLAEHATRLAINIHSCVNAATQWAGIEALKGPQDTALRMVAAFDERRRVILERLNALPGFRCVRPGGAFYVFPNITGTGYSSRELQDQLRTSRGRVMSAPASATGRSIRFSYANSIANIEEAIERIARFLER